MKDEIKNRYGKAKFSNDVLYQHCPMSTYSNGRCVFAWWYAGTLRCFYGCNETIIERRGAGGSVVDQPNVECPKRKMWRDSQNLKMDKLRWEAAMRELAEVEVATEGG